MARRKKEDRVSDLEIQRLNHVGIGQGAIAKRLNCHSVTVAQRLRALGVKSVDTRRSFMESVFNALSAEEQEWLSTNLFNADVSIHDFVVTLIRQAFDNAPPEAVAAPEEVELEGGDVDDTAEEAVPEVEEEVLAEEPVEQTEED